MNSVPVDTSTTFTTTKTGQKIEYTFDPEDVLSESWGYVESMVTGIRATGGNCFGQYYLLTALNALGDAGAYVNQCYDEEKEVDEDKFNRMIQDALDELGVINNDLRRY